MSLFDGKPIGRIDLYARKPAPVEISSPLGIMVGEAAERQRIADAERIWRAVQASAEATNQP